MTNERPTPGIFLGVYGLAQQLNRIKISGNKIYCSKAKGAAGSGIRFHALTGSSDIEVGMNTVAGCRTGWQDDDVAGDYENVIVHNNDLHDNAKPIAQLQRRRREGVDKHHRAGAGRKMKVCIASSVCFAACFCARLPPQFSSPLRPKASAKKLKATTRTARELDEAGII
jgi:hypothetical protein